jgi:hypothetical protein
MNAWSRLWRRWFPRKPTTVLVDEVLCHADERGNEQRLPLARLRSWTDHGDPWIVYVTLVTSTGEILHWSDPDDALAGLLKRTVPEKEASATRGTW